MHIGVLLAGDAQVVVPAGLRVTHRVRSIARSNGSKVSFTRVPCHMARTRRCKDCTERTHTAAVRTSVRAVHIRILLHGDP